MRTKTILEGRQSWRRLLFLHWPVPPAAVRAAVPASVPLDLRDGTAWVSVVAFDIEAARPPVAPAWLGLDFLETNARTYVRMPGGEPAVWFFSLEAASRLAVAAARLAYGLPYFHARMARSREDGAEVYRTARRGPEAPGLEVRYRVGAPLGTAAPESLEEFLIERYALHAVRGGGRIVTVRVRHAPYPLRAVAVESVSEDLLEAAGVPRPGGLRPGSQPLAYYSDGVDVEVFRVLG
ncbi:hypothetical protein BH20GEM1_BH20GEM1_09150 [soil metagenome]